MRLFSEALLEITVGGLLALAASAIGWGLGWLDFTGALAAFVMGSVVFGLGGLPWAAVLLTFFISSSLLSILFKSHKIESEKYAAKGLRRDAGQVLANGGLAGLAVIVYGFFPQNGWAWMGFAAAFAAANADTWATEIGALSRRRPVLITTGKVVEKGTSGGISLLGTVGSIFGSGIVALVACLIWSASTPVATIWVFCGIFFAGVLGSLVDSLLGATLQQVNYCPSCQKATEMVPLHSCGTATRRLRGWSWLNNDWVNFFCTAGAIAGIYFFIAATSFVQAIF